MELVNIVFLLPALQSQVYYDVMYRLLINQIDSTKIFVTYNVKLLSYC